MMNAVLFMSVAAIGIWLYPEYASKKLRTLLLVAPSTNQSMFGKGYASLGQGLLRSVKSTHILHLSLAFLTKTTLESQLV